MSFFYKIFVFAALLVVSRAQRIGGPCTGDPECTLDNSHCASNQCACDEKFTSRDDLMACLEIRDGTGQDCEQNDQCQKGKLGYLSTCLSGQCQCTSTALKPPGMDICMLKATKINENCTLDVQCEALGHAKCLSEKCVCNDVGVPSVDLTKCLSKLYLGDSCDTTEPAQCTHISNAACSATQRVCACNTLYVEDPTSNKRMCLREAGKIGDECKNTVQCTKLEGSICDGEKCGCLPGQVGNDDYQKCVPLVYNLEEPCTDNNQCNRDGSDCLPDTNSATGKSCLCNNGHIQDGNICIQAKQLGDICGRDLECSKIGFNKTVKCRSNVCACPFTEPPSRFYNQHCVRPALLGELCDDHDSCALGVNNITSCAGSPRKCKCPNSAVVKEGKCWTQLRIGGACSRDEECRQTIFGPVRCVDYKCMCDPGFPANADGFRCTGSSLSVFRAQYILTVFVTLFITVAFSKQ